MADDDTLTVDPMRKGQQDKDYACPVAGCAGVLEETKIKKVKGEVQCDGLVRHGFTFTNTKYLGYGGIGDFSRPRWNPWPKSNWTGWENPNSPPDVAMDTIDLPTEVYSEFAWLWANGWRIGYRFEREEHPEKRGQYLHHHIVLLRDAQSGHWTAPMPTRAQVMAALGKAGVTWGERDLSRFEGSSFQMVRFRF